MLNLTKRSMSILIIILMLSGMFLYAAAEPVFARDGPDVELYAYGEKSNGGPLFSTKGNVANGLWAPGITYSGTMRIYNNYSNRISIHNLGIRMKLYNTNSDKPVSDVGLIEEFAKAMKLTIKKGRRLVFSNTIYDKSFYEMLYNSSAGDQKGYALGILDRINISRNDYTDLEYTVHMDESAGNNLQGLRATVDFIVNLQENPDNELPDDRDDDDDDRDKGKRKNNLIEEPIDIIPDINGHWAHDCIVALIQNGVLIPDSSGSVRPDDYITRSEAAVLVGKALKLEESKTIGTGYVDAVPTWARGYIIATTEAGIFKGYPGKIFKAFGNISREEMTAVLIRAFRKNSTSERELNFKDRDRIAGWARGNVAASVEEGIVTGYEVDNTFRPKAYMTRAEAFTIVCKLLGYHEEHNKKLSYVNLGGGELIEQ